MLEELKRTYQRDYVLHHINALDDLEKQRWSAEVDSESQLPVLLDHNNGSLVVMEEGEILEYLATTYDPGKLKSSNTGIATGH